MKTKKIAGLLPSLASIGLGIVSLMVPFLLANHYIFTEGKRYSVDNYLFFFWGKYYTVVGSKIIQSKTVMYDFGDFPVYVMIVIVVALVLMAMSIFGGRGLVLNIKGREVKLKLDYSPLWLQIYAFGLLLIAYIYLGNATEMLTGVLEINNYTVERGPSFDFLLGSLIAAVISIVIIATKYLKTKNDVKNIQKDAI